MKSLKVVLIIFLAISNVCFCQIKNDTLTAWEYYQKADALFEDDKHVESVLIFKKALLIYQSQGIWEKVASCYNKIASNEWRSNQLDASLLNANKALEISSQHLANEHPQVAYAYDNMANYYKKKWELENAILYFNKSLKIKQKTPKKLQAEIIETNNWLGFVYLDNGNLDKGIKSLLKNKDICEEAFGIQHKKTSDAYKNLASGYSKSKEYDKSVYCYNKALEIATIQYGIKHIKTGYVYLKMSGLYMSLYEYDTALSFLSKSLPILVSNNDYKALRIQYSNMAYIYNIKGELERALEYIKKSIDLTRLYFQQDQQEVASSYRKIGIIYKKRKEYETALRYLNKSLQIYKTSFGDKNTNISKVYYEIGRVYYQKKQYDKALLFYQKVTEVRNSKVSSGSLKKRIGRVYERKGMYKKALFYYQESLQNIHQKYSSDHYLTSYALYRMGFVYLKQKEFDKAITYFKKAEYSNIRKDNREEYKNEFNPENYHNLKALLNILRGKSRALAFRFKKYKNKQDLYDAVVTYENIELLVNYLRQSYGNYNDKLSLAKQVKELYYDGLEIQRLLYKETSDQKDLANVFKYAEKAKANTLKELLSEDHATNIAGIPQALLNQKQIIKTKQSFYHSQIIESHSDSIIDASKIELFENKLFALNRKQDSLTQILEKNFPKYYKLKHENNVISVNEIQNKIDSNTTLIEFFKAYRNTYVFVISKNKFEVTKLKTPGITKKITKQREAVISKNTKEYKKLAYQLYKELIMPIKDQLIGDQLIIVPDGSLWNLNFELLLTQETISESPEDYPYLLRDYAITYANSATLYFNPFEDKKHNEKQEGCLAFSFSNTSSITGSKSMSLATLRGIGDDLPGTRKEIRAISEIVDGQYYFGAQATEAAFKKNARNYKILHLALHGEVDNEHPENSKLYFTKSNDTIEDNMLYSHELFALNIPAELTVLSACNTGTGKLAEGEGIMSLGNAFQYAGTKSLLLSNWEVPDNTTPQLMQYFYTHLRTGMNKAKALQQAKLQYLDQADMYKSTPFYWGGFYLLGDTAPIDFGTNTMWYWWFGLGVLLILFWVVYYWKK